MGANVLACVRRATGCVGLSPKSGPCRSVRVDRRCRQPSCLAWKACCCDRYQPVFWAQLVLGTRGRSRPLNRCRVESRGRWGRGRLLVGFTRFGSLKEDGTALRDNTRYKQHPPIMGDTRTLNYPTGLSLASNCTFMILSRKGKNFFGGRDLVKKSARLSSVFTYGTISSPFSIASRT